MIGRFTGIVVKALPAGRAFCSRIYLALQRFARSLHFIRVSNKIKLDLQMWVVFLENFNGYTNFHINCRLLDDTFKLYTDSSEANRCSVVLSDEWSWLARLVSLASKLVKRKKERYYFPGTSSNSVENFHLDRRFSLLIIKHFFI